MEDPDDAPRFGDVERGPAEVEVAGDGLERAQALERDQRGVFLDAQVADGGEAVQAVEALQPGRPLAFLDAHIRVGNSLLGIILPLRIVPGVGLATPNGRWARLFHAYARVREGSDIAASSAELRPPTPSRSRYSGRWHHR